MTLKEVVEVELKAYPDEAEVAVNAGDIRKVGGVVDAAIPDLRPVKTTVGALRELVAKFKEEEDGN